MDGPGRGVRRNDDVWRVGARQGRLRAFRDHLEPRSRARKGVDRPMSTTERINEPLAKLTAAGVSIWLDQIARSLIEDGELERMVQEESLRGVTSNPSIFEK